MSFVHEFLMETGQVIERIDRQAIEQVADLLAETRT